MLLVRYTGYDQFINSDNFILVMKKQGSDQSIQINKYISNSGFCSRREAYKLVNDARVTINDELALATSRVYTGDVVAIDGEKIKSK